MLNAIELGTVIPIHRHPHTSTTLIVLRGSIRHNIFDSYGNLDKSIMFSSDSEIKVIQIEAGRWHNFDSLESGAIIFEAKDGSWEPYQQLINTV